MNNFLYTKNAIAFIYKGNTYEAQIEWKWVSIKTVIDPSVKFMMEKNGSIREEVDLKKLAEKAKTILISKIDDNEK